MIGTVLSSLNHGEFVELFEFDVSTSVKRPSATDFPFTLLRITSAVNPDGSSVVWGTTTYSFNDIKFSGLKLDSGGTLPAPTLELTAATESASGGVFSKFFNKNGDFRGVKVTRTIIEKRFLANGATPDTSLANVKQQVFYIDQLTQKKGHQMSFKLSIGVGIDNLNDTVNRVMSTNRCNLKYRVWDVASGTFKYTPTTDGGCPWGSSETGEQALYPNCGANWGSPFFDSNDDTTSDPAKDRCSLSVAGCLKRFPNTGATTDVFPISINLKGGTKGTT